MRAFVILAASLAGLIAAPTVTGQQQGEPRETGRRALVGALRGEVFTIAPNGERHLVPEAKVLLVLVPGPRSPGQAAPPRMESETDIAGRFEFDVVPAGCYAVKASSAGLAGEGSEICLLAPGGVVDLAIELKSGVLKESVEVSAEPEGIETVVDSATLSDVPSINERFQDYLPLLPGVIRGPDGRINLKGARAAQGGALVDGANVTDPVTGETAINLPIDAVSSVSVLSNPYDSQYGKFAGAVSTVDTGVSHFNKFRFKIQNFLPRLRSRDGATVGIGGFTPRLTVSTPLLPGRVSLLQSLEYRFVRTEIEGAGLPPLESDTVLESYDSFTQFNFQINDRHAAMVNVSFYPQKQNYFGLNTFLPQAATPNLRQRGYMVSLRDVYAFPSGAVLQSQLSTKILEVDVLAQSDDLFQMGIETTTGGFFNRQNRETTRLEWTETYHFAPGRTLGRHLPKAGLAFVRNSYDGRQIFRPVEILGVSDRLVERVDFGDPALVDVDQDEYMFFVQDQWTVRPRLTFDFGIRFERDAVAEANHVAPRLGMAYLLTKDMRTVLRGGLGLFYDRVTLNLPTFLQLPERRETIFSPTGTLLGERVYRHRQVGRIRNPSSYVWSLQLDREVAANLFMRFGLQQRNTTRDILLDPERTEQGDFLTLKSSGRSRYRELEMTTKYRFRGRHHLTASYVWSSALGDLNDFNTFFGNLGKAVIRPNERSRLAFDAPHRLLFWANLAAPYGLTVSPVLDVHSGFPYSLVNEQRDFVGPRNRAGRFPTFASFDLQVLKEVTLPFKKGKYKVRAGFKAFNLLNRFNPRDIQNNVASPASGYFFQQ